MSDQSFSHFDAWLLPLLPTKAFAIAVVVALIPIEKPYVGLAGDFVIHKALSYSSGDQKLTASEIAAENATKVFGLGEVDVGLILRDVQRFLVFFRKRGGRAIRG